MTTGTIRKAALAVAISISAGSALAESPTPASAFVPNANLSRIEVHEVVPQERPLTVMGMTGGIEPKYGVTTGSIGTRLDRPQWLRLR